MEQKKWNRNDRRPPLRRAQEPSEAAENMLEGRNAVQEALAAGRPIDKLYIAAGETDRALARLAAMAKEAGAAVVETDRRKLDQLSATGAHQGVVAMVAAHAYATVDEILENAKSSWRSPRASATWRPRRSRAAPTGPGKRWRTRMIYIETGSTDVYYNFGLEYYFAAEKKLPEPVLLFWRTTPTLMVGK